MKLEEQSVTGDSPEQTDQQNTPDSPTHIAIKDGDIYYGLLSNHFMCTKGKQGPPVFRSEPNITRKYCGGCGRSLLPCPESGTIAVSDKVIRRIATNHAYFGYAQQVTPWENCVGVQVRWNSVNRIDWVRADELMQFSEWEKENPMPSLCGYWSASPSEQASICRRAGRY